MNPKTQWMIHLAVAVVTVVGLVQSGRSKGWLS
jgi:hypothetical protein